MAQDPSEYWRELESYSLSDPELEHENERLIISVTKERLRRLNKKPSTLTATMTFQGGAVKKFVC